MKKFTRFLSAVLLFCLTLSLFSCSFILGFFDKGAWRADADAMKKAEELAPSHELMIGAWVTPRPHLMLTQEEADARYAEIKESGINMVYSFGETADRAHLDRMLNAAYKNGVSVIIDLSPTVFESHISANLETVLFTKDYPAVIGYCMQDEPCGTTFDLLGQEYDAIREVAGDEKIIMCNLYPNYAKSIQLGVPAADGLTEYQNYLDKSLRLTYSDVLSFNYYPFFANASLDGEFLNGMLRNFTDIAICQQKYNAPAWGFVQSGSSAGRRIPNADELRFLSHLHLIFGLESYSYFMYSQPDESGSYQGMLNYDGTRTANYNVVKANNEAISGLQGRYLEYDLKGFYTAELSDNYANAIGADLKLSEYGALTSAEGSRNLLVGVFENDKGETAYYVLNFDYKYANTVTLQFSAVSAYTLWGADGIEQMGGQRKISFDLLPGEGKFVEMKTFTEQ